MTGVAALALCAGFVGCSKDDDVYDPNAEANLIQAQYDAAFIKTFGQPAADQDWGFGATSKARMITRADAVIPGDPFTFENTENYYISSEDEIPTTAKTYEEAVAAATTTYTWGSNFSENDFQNASEVILPDGTYSMHWWSGTHTLYVTGDVTLNVNESKSINQAKIYVLTDATLTLNMTNYINDLEIYVAAGGTLNYGYEMLYKQTGGGKIYNRGTVNFTKDEFQANQDAIVYNEGDMVINNLTSGPGSNNPSCFYNFGNLEVKGMVQLNSCANFFNEGTTTVVGKTEVTQQGIYWINKGHYTTASMEFSAWNSSFYNFCQLFVLGEAHMYDGAFNLMDESYTEVGSAKMNNFVVNMGSDAGMNIKGDLSVYGQGDNHYQGFTTDGTNDYLRVGGTITVGAHKLTLELTGNITYAYNNLVDQGASDTGVYPTYRFNTGTQQAELSDLTVIPNEEDCGATWTIRGGNGPKLRVFAEDLSARADETVAEIDENSPSDWDFNDVVFDAEYVDATHAKITLWAAGGTLPLRFNKDNSLEVHKLFNVGVKTMVNTHAKEVVEGVAGYGWKDNEPERVFTITIDGTRGNFDDETYKDNFPLAVRDLIIIEVEKNGSWYELTAQKGKPACKIATSAEKVKWVKERTDIRYGYETFKQYVGYPSVEWWKPANEPVLYNVDGNSVICKHCTNAVVE